MSVWLTLDLLLEAKLADEVVLEPASEEDLEAELREYEPGSITGQVTMGDYQLVVQAKLRRGDAWTVNGLKNLLVHGGESRQSAAKRLANPTTKYLLVTSAALNGLTRDLGVHSAGVWPKAPLPKSIAPLISCDATGRVAVIGSQDEARLKSEIKRLLTESFRVPNARWQACWTKLREEARVRILGGGGGRWLRSELEHLITVHDGYLASSPELARYVHPTNWHELRSRIAERHAALIIGQSGTGKTLATKKLFEELRKEIPGLAHVQITHGPHQLRNDQTPPPVLYDIEDPWGRFDFDPNSRPWNDQVAGLLAGARADRMIIATSRLDVANSADILKDVKPWIVALEAEHYGKRERSRLYQARIADLPRALQLLAKQSEKRVLDELATPLEIQKFFDALTTLDRTELNNPPGFIRTAIARAHETSIERTVIDQIEQRNDVRAAAVIWGMLKASDKLSLGVLRTLEEGLIDRDPEMSNGVRRLVSFFVAARNLRQSAEVITYYHPRVEAGIERTLEKHDAPTRRTLRHLIDVLMSPDGPDEAWGVSAAARLVAAADQSADLKPKPSPKAQAKIDNWLANALQTAGRELEAYLALAAAAGSADCNVSEIARYILHRPDKSFPAFLTWGKPEHGDDWYARIKADPATKPLLESFIREVLPSDRHNYGKAFAQDVERLAPNLSAAFLAAAAEAAHYGVSNATEAILHGALKDLDGFEAVVDVAVDVLDPAHGDGQRGSETWLAIVNEEYSDDYAEHLADDSGYTAREYLKAYAGAIRRRRGWQALAQHRHIARLRWYWFRALRNGEKPKPLPEEIAGAFASGYGTNDEDDLWPLLEKHWDPQFRSPLKDRTIAGHASKDIRLAALSCLVACATDDIADIVDRFVRDDSRSRLVQLALDLASLLKRSQGMEAHGAVAAVKVAMTTLPSPYSDISGAALTLEANGVPSLGSEGRQLLASIAPVDEELRCFRVLLDKHLELPIEDDVRWILEHSDDRDAAVTAIEAAIRHEMGPEIQAALTHRFAHVSARALEAVATSLSAPLPAHILSLVNIKGSPMRKVLVALLDRMPHVDHLPTLVEMAKDTWSRHASYEHENQHYPIAQAAVNALAKIGPLPAPVAQALLHVATESDDPRLRAGLLTELVRFGGRDMQDRILDLALLPGRLAIRRAAANALVVVSDALPHELVARIIPDLLISRTESVASMLAVLLSLRGDMMSVDAAAQRLSTSAERRVFLVLMIWKLNGRDPSAAGRVAKFLPRGHIAAAWALGAHTGIVANDALDDLGSPAAVAQVLPHLKPAKP
ncbi:hypothetical protein [Hyphomicrobium sp. CS1BSMeth3]|uniref:nSTAND3 domain-containing NTPase n=1 Tax=Hyphomicrobium sp. CS1BSMeth3 TaxID=1892844 RepID=UPI0011607F0F|nr:hypothetical protein [Hyphomicrobium sp. CS1BSMeth3]